jgi:hypothetical protein
MRRLVITVCPREPGVVVLPVERGGRARRLDAAAIVRDLHELITRRQLADHVSLREGCAGGCYGSGPNLSVTIYPPVRPGERADGIAVSWKTYVYTLATLTCLAQVIEENLDASPPAPTRTPRGQSARRPLPPVC